MARYTHSLGTIYDEVDDTIITTTTGSRDESKAERDRRVTRIVKALNLADVLDALPIPEVPEGPFVASDHLLNDANGDMVAEVDSIWSSDADASVASYLAAVLNAVATYKAQE